MTQAPSAWWHYVDRKRVELDLTGAEFATRSGIGKSHAYQILKGERPQATLETLRAVARGLGITPSELLAGMGEGAEDEPEVAEMTALFRHLPKPERKTARQILNALTPANSHTKPRANAQNGTRGNLDAARRNEHKNRSDPPLTEGNHWPKMLRFFTPRMPLALTAG